MLIVSLAVIASRISNLPEILACLERQTAPPDKILIYYSYEPWHLDSGMNEPLSVHSNLDVEMIAVPNLGSCRKYLHTINRYRHTDATVVLIDDDTVWKDDVFQALAVYTAVGQAATTRGWSEFDILYDGLWPRFQRGRPVVAHKIWRPTEVLVPSSGWATMFRAADVNPQVLDPRLHRQYRVAYSDEIFLSAMLRARKFVVPMSEPFYRLLPTPSTLSHQQETFYAKALQTDLLDPAERRRLMPAAAVRSLHPWAR
ncbi:MAG: hypothetical protein HYW51_01350 [Candidatus Doudnabacteria bacterium]|nr:hypothetical protein [Candidatus Doudnabacteria bacterium]